MIDAETLGQRIRQYRTEASLSEAQLGAIVGVSAEAVGSWERGDSIPDGSRLSGLCKALGKTAEELYGLAAEPQAAGVTAEPGRKCSFCGKPQPAVGQLITGPAVAICRECVALCRRKLTEGDTAK